MYRFRNLILYLNFGRLCVDKGSLTPCFSYVNQCDVKLRFRNDKSAKRIYGVSNDGKQLNVMSIYQELHITIKK